MVTQKFRIGANYQRQEEAYRQKALKLFPWVCGSCAREFTYSNLRELTVHHIDHDHTNNPSDGSNWELLCLYCHDNEHAKYTDFEQYGGSANNIEEEKEPAKFQPFADLKQLLNKDK